MVVAMVVKMTIIIIGKDYDIDDNEGAKKG